MKVISWIICAVAICAIKRFVADRVYASNGGAARKKDLPEIEPVESGSVDGADI